jgi:hypothetical protein
MRDEASSDGSIRRIEFAVGGEIVVGDLHLPEGPGPYPGVVVAGPMTSVKEQVTGVYAAALARRGIAALAIDHRHFGESGGEPRGYEHWERKVEDLRAAIDALSSRPEVDAGRIGGAGVCLGSGYMAHAAAGHPGVRAVGFVAGYYRDPEAMRRADPSGFDAKVEQGRMARERWEATGELLAIPAVSLEGDAALQTADTFDYYARRAAHANYRNRFAVMSRERFLRFDVQAAAPKLRAPVLMIHSERALSPHWARAFADKLGDRAAVHWVESRGQTDFYDDPALVADVASRLVAHFGATLAD